ncbi:MAG: hypothetical protein AB7S75_24400 [Desulfococcaceae bacterium]
MKINIPFQFTGTGQKLEACDTFLVYFFWKSPYVSLQLCVFVAKKYMVLLLYQFAIDLIQYCQFFRCSACAKNRSAQFLHSALYKTNGELVLPGRFTIWNL